MTSQVSEQVSEDTKIHRYIEELKNTLLKLNDSNVAGEKKERIKVMYKSIYKYLECFKSLEHLNRITSGNYNKSVFNKAELKKINIKFEAINEEVVKIKNKIIDNKIIEIKEIEEIEEVVKKREEERRESILKEIDEINTSLNVGEVKSSIEGLRRNVKKVIEEIEEVKKEDQFKEISRIFYREFSKSIIEVKEKVVENFKKIDDLCKNSNINGVVKKFFQEEYKSLRQEYNKLVGEIKEKIEEKRKSLKENKESLVSTDTGADRKGNELVFGAIGDEDALSNELSEFVTLNAHLDESVIPTDVDTKDISDMDMDFMDAKNSEIEFLLSGDKGDGDKDKSGLALKEENEKRIDKLDNSLSKLNERLKGTKNRALALGLLSSDHGENLNTSMEEMKKMLDYAAKNIDAEINNNDNDKYIGFKKHLEKAIKRLGQFKDMKDNYKGTEGEKEELDQLSRRYDLLSKKVLEMREEREINAMRDILNAMKNAENKAVKEEELKEEVTKIINDYNGIEGKKRQEEFHKLLEEYNSFLSISTGKITERLRELIKTKTKEEDRMDKIKQETNNTLSNVGGNIPDTIQTITEGIRLVEADDSQETLQSISELTTEGHDNQDQEKSNIEEGDHSMKEQENNNNKLSAGESSPAVTEGNISDSSILSTASVSNIIKIILREPNMENMEFDESKNLKDVADEVKRYYTRNEQSYNENEKNAKILTNVQEEALKIIDGIGNIENKDELKNEIMKVSKILSTLEKKIAELENEANENIYDYAICKDIKNHMTIHSSIKNNLLRKIKALISVPSKSDALKGILKDINNNMMKHAEYTEDNRTEILEVAGKREDADLKRRVNYIKLFYKKQIIPKENVSFSEYKPKEVGKFYNTILQCSQNLKNLSDEIKSKIENTKNTTLFLDDYNKYLSTITELENITKRFIECIKETQQVFEKEQKLEQQNLSLSTIVEEKQDDQSSQKSEETGKQDGQVQSGLLRGTSSIFTGGTDYVSREEQSVAASFLSNGAQQDYSPRRLGGGDIRRKYNIQSGGSKKRRMSVTKENAINRSDEINNKRKKEGRGNKSSLKKNGINGINI